MTTLIIIGGGIGGLAAAACLQRRAVEAQVYEQAPNPRENESALALWPNATRVLHRLGVLEPVRQRGHAITMAVLKDPRGRVLRQTALPPTDSPALAIHHTEALAALASLLPPESMHWGKQFVRTEHQGAHVRAIFTDGSASPWADGLIGADGCRSAVRSQPNGNEKPIRGCLAWRGVADSPSPEAACETWRRRQGFGTFPLGAGDNAKARAGWWAAAPTQNPEQMLLHATPAQWKTELLRRFGSWHSPIPALIEATPAERLLCNAMADHHALCRKHASPGLVTFVGDAARATTFQHGACMAIEDAALLANAVEAIPDPASAFRVYEATRQERAAMAARLRHRFHELWRYDAWSAPLMMPR